MSTAVEVRKSTGEIHHQISSQDFGALINLMDEMELVRETNPNRRKKVFEGGSELIATWLGGEFRKPGVIHIAFYRNPRHQLEPTDFFVIAHDDPTVESQQGPILVDWLLNNLVSPVYLPPPPELLQN
ncbi:hypothetical protein HYS29_02555 [Candidatus Microgenomates bacterium]|nr:hypothetical protein [Candidatus Microgenomates bacterium]